MQQVAHEIWNHFDEMAALMSLDRLPGETNEELQTRILNIGKFKEDTTRQGLINAISSALGYDQYNTVTRRVYTLTHTPYRSSSFTVTVDGVTQTQITVDDYDTATEGYIVWKNEDEVYTRILEFVSPPTFSRNSTTRKHEGSYVEITYQYEDGDRIRYWVDKCHPYDSDDESFMGWYPESEGDIKIRELNDGEWVDSPTNGLKNSDGTPTEKLKTIWRIIDESIPSTWGE